MNEKIINIPIKIIKEIDHSAVDFIENSINHDNLYDTIKGSSTTSQEELVDIGEDFTTNLKKLMSTPVAVPVPVAVPPLQIQSHNVPIALKKVTRGLSKISRV